MSDKLYNEVDIGGVPYEKGDWRKIVTHDDISIKGFFGDYRFLSNFESCKVHVWGLYPSVENAYQAMKVTPESRTVFYTCSASESKKIWKDLPANSLYSSKEEWDKAKYDIMFSAVFDKFLMNKDLQEKLIKTNIKFLEETNWWEDEYWGVNYSTRVGLNKLGDILMKVREISICHMR